MHLQVRLDALHDDRSARWTIARNALMPIPSLLSRPPMPWDVEEKEVSLYESPFSYAFSDPHAPIAQVGDYAVRKVDLFRLAEETQAPRLDAGPLAPGAPSEGAGAICDRPPPEQAPTLCSAPNPPETPAREGGGPDVTDILDSSTGPPPDHEEPD